MIIPGASFVNNEPNSEDCWIKVQCSKCMKCAYVKKPREILLQHYLIKVVYSVWTVHVYGLSLSPNDNWTSANCNKDWNVCSERNSTYFFNLKSASRKDVHVCKTISKRGNAYTVDSNIVRAICERIFSTYTNSILAIVVNAFSLCESLEDDRRIAEEKKLWDKDNPVSEPPAIGNNGSSDINNATTTNNNTTTNNETGKKPKKRKIVRGKETDDEKRRRYYAEKAWFIEYKADLLSQKSFWKIMYVLPLQIQWSELYPVSKEFVDYYKSEEYKTGTYVDPELDSQFSHFVALTKNTKNNPGRWHVISREYFTVTNRLKVVVKRRISSATITNCINNPNRVSLLTREDKRLISIHVQECTIQREIIKIKKMEFADPKVEYSIFDYRETVSGIQYQGLDKDDGIHKLSNDWIEMTFKEDYPEYYQLLLRLDHTHKYVLCPKGARKRKLSNYPLTTVSDCVQVRYQENNDPSCLYCSLASALHYKRYFRGAAKLMEVYDLKNTQGYYIPIAQDVIHCLRNKYRDKCEYKLKYDVVTVTDMDIDDILDVRDCYIYWCILRNNHAVALVDDYIFDPEFSKTLPRNRTGMRISSEIEKHEPIHDCIYRCYRIDNRDKHGY